MKMTTLIISCLISFVLGAGSMGVYNYNLPAKTVINNNKTIQNVENNNEQISRQDQSQTTIILQIENGNTNQFRYVAIKSDGKTNKVYTFTSKSNQTSTTN